MKLAGELTCAELVELVTDYLDGALPSDDAGRFEEHIILCPGCASHFDQMRESIRVSGRLREEDLPPDVADRLVQAFRGWSEERE